MPRINAHERATWWTQRLAVANARLYWWQAQSSPEAREMAPNAISNCESWVRTCTELVEYWTAQVQPLRAAA